MEATLRRQSIDLPADVLARLSELAVESGKSLKSYMEGVLVNTAQRAGNPSPSGDTWFDDPENIQMILTGKKQIEQGKCTSYTADELILYIRK